MCASASSTKSPTTRSRVTIEYADVTSNTELCREHARLTLRLRELRSALPGQFVQLSPAPDPRCPGTSRSGEEVVGMPLLPRAFSIAALRDGASGCEIDVIYRVVGVATRWMRGLQPGALARVLGPLGRQFPIDPVRRTALLVGGGVGLPPLLFLAEALRRAGKRTIALLGAQSADLVPLDLVGRQEPARDAAQARLCAREFADFDVPVVISTDDGSLGFRGTVVDALIAFVRAQPIDPADTVVYTCGPERMMHATARWCRSACVNCQVCMERPMACGLGTCQSCVVTVRSAAYASGQRYALCCSEGPIFDAEDVIWEECAA